jgi:hypothetical protein
MWLIKNFSQIVSECGLLKISVNETDTTTSGPVYIDLENKKKVL